MTGRYAAQRRTRAFYDAISRAYDFIADSSEHAPRDLGLRMLAVSPGEKVLVIGCGTGHALTSIAEAVGQLGHVHGVDISSGMMTVAQQRIQSAGLRNVGLMIGDAQALPFRSGVFDAVFMSFTLELFETAILEVLAEVRRALRTGGRLGIVAMSETGQTNAMINLYKWVHRHWPLFVDCKPIDVVGALRAAHFDVASTRSTTIWSLPVMAATGIRR